MGDIMLDERLKPWLLEVNLLPSLSSSSPLDKRIKSTLMCDVFHCVGMEPVDIKAAKRAQHEDDTASESSSEAEAEPLSKRVLLREICDQFNRRGNLRLIFPRIFNVAEFAPLHTHATDNDRLLWNFLSLPVVDKQALLEGDMDSDLERLLTMQHSFADEADAQIETETASNTTVTGTPSPQTKKKIKKRRKSKRRRHRKSKTKGKAREKISRASSSTSMVSMTSSMASSSLSSGRIHYEAHASPMRQTLPISTKNIGMDFIEKPHIGLF